jgi:hypothetical protein
MNIENIAIENTPDGDTIHKGDLTVTLMGGKKQKCRVEYRIKSIEGILTKLWADEDYTNVDAIRDICGIAIIWPDDTPDDIQAEIIKKCSRGMSNYGYTFKETG